MNNFNFSMKIIFFSQNLCNFFVFPINILSKQIPSHLTRIKMSFTRIITSYYNYIYMLPSITYITY